MIAANFFSLTHISRDTRKEKEEEEENEWRRLAPDKERFYPWTFWKNWTIAQRTKKERGGKMTLPGTRLEHIFENHGFIISISNDRGSESV